MTTFIFLAKGGDGFTGSRDWQPNYVGTQIPTTPNRSNSEYIKDEKANAKHMRGSNQTHA